MVSVHNAALFDELREEAYSMGRGNDRVLDFGDEDEDEREQVGDLRNAGKIDISSCAAEYFATQTSPPKTLNSARSDRSISSVISQRHHNRLYFPDQRVGREKESGKAEKVSPRARKRTPRMRSPRLPVHRDPSPIAVDRPSRERKAGAKKSGVTPPKEWDTTKPTSFSPQKIQRMSVPKMNPTQQIITKEEKMFLRARERNLKMELANKKRAAMEAEKQFHTEQQIERRFEEHKSRQETRKQLHAIERNRKMQEKEKRAMSNLDSYFQQRNDKALNALLKQNSKKKGARVGSASSRHNMQAIAAKKVKVLEQDRLERLLRRVEEQDQRIEKLEREKRQNRRKHADARAKEQRNLGYRGAWARRQRTGGLRSAGASIARRSGARSGPVSGPRKGGSKKLPKRSPSAMSTRSEQPNYEAIDRKRASVRSRGAMSVASAPYRGGDGQTDPYTEDRIAKLEVQKKSQWFTEEDEEDGVGESYSGQDGDSSSIAYSANAEMVNGSIASDYSMDSGSNYSHQQRGEAPAALTHANVAKYQGQVVEQPGPPVERNPMPHKNGAAARKMANMSLSAMQSRGPSKNPARPLPPARQHQPAPPQPEAGQQQQQPGFVGEPYGSPCWYYIDIQGVAQGPFTDHQMHGWHRGNFFTPDLRMRRGLHNPSPFIELGTLFPNFEKAFENGEGPCPVVN